MKNKKLKDALTKFNDTEDSKLKDMDILNDEKTGKIKGGTSDYAREEEDFDCDEFDCTGFGCKEYD